MRNKIEAAVFGVLGLFVFACVSAAAEVNMSDFDTIYAHPMKTVNNLKVEINIPKVNQEIVSDKFAVEKPVESIQAFVMKDILKDAPENKVSDFLNSLVLKNGRIISADVDVFKNVLSESGINRIKDAIFHKHVSNGVGINNMPARYANISKLMADVPEQARNEFLGSMMFKNGAFVSAYVGGLLKVVGKDKTDVIIKAVATTSGEIHALNSRNLCDTQVCYDAICKTTSADPQLHCEDHINSVCDSYCHSYN